MIPRCVAGNNGAMSSKEEVAIFASSAVRGHSVWRAHDERFGVGKTEI